MSDPDHGATRRKLRRELRAARRALGAAERREADRALIRNIQAWAPYQRARRVGVYLAFDGEPDLERLVTRGLAQGKRFYVPKLRGDTMEFVPLTREASLDRNFFGILEPARRGIIDVRRLDIVLTPLVAFDDRGTRVGVGRGYYDRCFKNLVARGFWFHPKLVGAAYELQRTRHLDRQPWDVPLWGVVTERGAQMFTAR